MNAPAIKVTGLTKAFPIPFQRTAVVAVRDLDLEVRPGEVYGLLGPNGSGKSTTFKIILGLVSPTRGRAEIFGQDSSDTASRKSVGFLPENPYFYKHLTALETVRFYGRLSGLSGRALETRGRDLLELVGLTNATNRRLAGFSKGMLQRIGLAQALVHHPRLLVLDEPTAGVDPVGSREIRDLVLRLKNEGITILLSSHLLSQVQEVCDRIGILAEGRLIREGTIQDLLAVTHQTEVILENAPAALLDKIEALAVNGGARVVERRVPQTTLERIFLEALGS